MPRNHDPNNTPMFRYDQTRRSARADRPEKTIDTQQQDARWIQPIIGGGMYRDLLSSELPREAPSETRLRLAELFCGCGGIGLGFRSAGFELAFATDYWAPAARTYEANLGHAPVVSDVRKVTIGDGGIDVLTGGFPCVTFSTAGRRMGVVDDVAGKLYLELCRLIREVRPRYFIAENVRGILSANGGAAVKLVLAAFLRLGYRVQYRLVNMAEHGIPQTRERVIFVGTRLDQWRGAFRFPAETHRLHRDKLAKRWLARAVSLRDAIGDLPAPGEEIRMLTHQGGATLAALGRAPTEGYGYSRPRRPGDPAHSQATNPNSLHVRGARNPDFYNPIVSASEPGPTVTSSEPPELSIGGHEPNHKPASPTHTMSMRVAPSPTIVSEADNVQPWIDGVRRMTVRECARVQSFPDWFEFSGSQADGYRQVGNAVPPLYAKRLAEAILEYDAREILR